MAFMKSIKLFILKIAVSPSWNYKEGVLELRGCYDPRHPSHLNNS